MPKTVNRSTAIFYFLSSVFAAFASYRAHLEGAEELAFPIFENIISFEGRAPDQYRIFPYLLIDILRDSFNHFGSQSPLKHAIIAFDASFLFLSVSTIQKRFAIKNIRFFLVILLLLYPYLMFDGYRPISSFILFLAVVTVCSMASIKSRRDLAVAVCLLVILSFSRADAALLLALTSFSWGEAGRAEKLLLASVAPAIQLALMFMLFPQAQYYTDVIMVRDNLSLYYLFNSPLTYFLVGACIFFRKELLFCFGDLFRHYRFAMLVIPAYLLSLFIIARPNEYRLFLPLIPVALVMLEGNPKRRSTARPSPGVQAGPDA